MQPPFHANPDAHRCLHATLRMAVEARRPDTPVPWALLDSLTQRRPGEGTWTHAAYLALPHLGVRAHALDAFDYVAFAADPVRTLRRDLPLALAMRMLGGNDLDHAARLAHVLLALEPIPIVRRSPDLADIDRLLDEGALLIANVDQHTLDDTPGLSGHSVLVYGRDGDDLVLHDPGARGQGHPGRRVGRERFERAWSYMGEGLRELLVVEGRNSEAEVRPAG